MIHKCKIVEIEDDQITILIDDTKIIGFSNQGVILDVGIEAEVELEFYDNNMELKRIMPKYIWRKSNYKLMERKWGIFILLEAGYQITSLAEIKRQYIKLTDQIYFHSMLLPYPKSETLLADEWTYFYNGLKLVNKYISSFIPEDSSLIIALRQIQFSDCYIQNEAFTACAIQWASETFQFPLPNITTYFDEAKSRNGMYVFDFSSV